MTDRIHDATDHAALYDITISKDQRIKGSKERIKGKDQGTVLRSALFPVEKAVDDSVWDSGESGKLAETCSLFKTGEYDLAA